MILIYVWVGGNDLARKCNRGRRCVLEVIDGKKLTNLRRRIVGYLIVLNWFIFFVVDVCDGIVSY